MTMRAPSAAPVAVLALRRHLITAIGRTIALHQHAPIPHHFAGGKT
jgi:hypothetical protein